jgi:hypothetical protein
MQTAHEQATMSFGVESGGPDAWGWEGRTLGRRAGAHWLRVLAAEQGKAGGKLWDGTAEAEAALPAEVPRPRLVGVRDWTLDGYAYRAELVEYVPRPVLSTNGPDLTYEPDLPAEWWAALRGTLKTLAAVPTERQAVRQQWIDRRFPEFLGIPGPVVEEWTTAHGDFHWGNLTGAPLTVLDWEGWGRAPVGYDAGLLHAYSLRAPAAAARVRVELSDVLDTPAGQVGELVALAELLQMNARGWHPELGDAWAARALELTDTAPLP